MAVPLLPVGVRGDGFVAHDALLPSPGAAVRMGELCVEPLPLARVAHDPKGSDARTALIAGAAMRHQLDGTAQTVR